MYIKYIIFSLLKVKYYNVFRILPTGGVSDRYNEIQQTRKKSQISVFFTVNTQNKGACVCPSEPVIALIG